MRAACRQKWAAGLLCLHLAAALVGAVEPAPETYVADRAGVMDDQRVRQLVGLLQELEQKTSLRVIVVTVDTIGEQDIRQYALERAEQWRFGTNQQGADCLIVVAVRDRQYVIETGYRVEGDVPDSLAGRIGREYMVPHFRAGDFSTGVFAGAAAVAEAIAAGHNVSLRGVPDLSQYRSQGPEAPCMLAPLLPLLFFLLLAGGLGRRRSGLFWGIMLGSMLGGRGGGFGGGGGGLGGGFGSFGGGGGGGFGGGGVSGRW